MVPLNYPPPEGFLEPETRCGHYISKQMKEVWAVELDLAQKLLEVCKKYNLKIYADYGTLLGAVRHKGFIPWDDDMDFCMPREDFEQLCIIANQEFSNPYCLENYENPKYNQLVCVARLRNSNTTAITRYELKRPNLNFNQGICIDIFPLDNVTSNKVAFMMQAKFIDLYQFLSWSFAYFSTRYFESDNFVLHYPKKITYLFFRKPFEKLSQYFFCKCTRTVKKFNYQDTLEYSHMTVALSPAIRKKEDYAEIKESPFEYISVPLFNGYDNILKAEYGNYHEIRKHTSAHDLIAGGILFDTNVSYKETINGAKKK